MLPPAPPFPHRLAGHCGSGALRDLLEFHGLDYGGGPLSEGAVFGLAGGLGFFYFSTPEVAPPIYLVGRTPDLERTVADNLALDLDVRETDDAATGWGWVRDEIAAGRPPMVWADIGELDYLRVRMHNTRHDIVVVGIDEQRELAWIADNDREELQPCSLDSLARARASTAFPGPNRHTTFFYGWPAKLPPLAGCARSAIGQAVRNMRDGRRMGLEVDGAFGLDGLEGFAAAYPTWPRAFGPKLDEALKALAVFIVKAGTGGAMFRSLHAEFLEYAASELGDVDLQGLADVYAELAKSWRALAATALAADHADGLGHVERISRLERFGVELMENWLAMAGTGHGA